MGFLTKQTTREGIPTAFGIPFFLYIFAKTPKQAQEISKYMDIIITEIEHYDESILQAFERLTPQLSESAPIPTAERLQSIIDSPTTHLLGAIDNDGTIVGVLTLLFYDIPTYCKAWIEDVITDSDYRGRGVGRALVERALEMAREHGADNVNLTSRPSREAARALYRKVGFEEVPTTVFRLNIHK